MIYNLCSALFLLTSTLSSVAFAQSAPTEGAPPNVTLPRPSDNEFSGGAEEYEQPHFTPAYIHQMISQNMKIQCSRGLCEMAMVDTKGHAFVVEVNAGYGNQNNFSNGGNAGGGVVVVAPGSSNYSNVPQPNFGLTIRYVAQRCKQSVRVPVSLYVSLNTYLYSLMNEDGSTKRTFDPAEQTMILFYTTLLKQASGCTTPTR